jgi:O-antigen/teichoic acid export membrane protein
MTPPTHGRTRPAQARGAVRALGTRFGLVIVGGATGVVISRALHPEGRGTYALVVAFASAAMAIGHLSLDQAHIALWPGRRAAVTANGAVLGPVLGGLAALGAGALAWTGLSGLGAAAHSGLLLVALLSVPPAVTVLYLSNILVLGARVATVDWATLTGGVLQCGALLGLAAAGRLSVGWVVWIWALSTAAPLLLILPVARPRLRDFDRWVARRSVSQGLRYHGGSAALYLTYRLDVLILGGMASAAAVGLYTLAVTLAELIRIPTEALARASLSRQAADDLAVVAAVTVRATRMSVLLAGASVGGLCAAAPVLVPAAYGADFAASVPALYALAPGLFALCAGRQVSAYLVRLNKPLTMSALSVAALVVNVAVNLVLIPSWGIVGCALASSASYTLIAAGQVYRFCRATGTPATRLLPGAGLLRRAGAVAASPLEDVLVATQPAAAGGQVPQREAAGGDEPEDLLGAGHLERVPADPVDQVVPARHAAGAGRRLRRAGRAAAGAQGADDRPHGLVPAEVQRTEPDEQQPAGRP